MSKNRDKKAPIFTSMIPSAYDFVDYTTTEQTANKNTFGNPTLSVPQSQFQTSNQPLKQSFNQILNQPQKKSESNWFENMLVTTESSRGKANQQFKISSPQSNFKSVEYSSTTTTSYGIGAPSPRTQTYQSEKQNYGGFNSSKTTTNYSQYQSPQPSYTGASSNSPQKNEYTSTRKQQSSYDYKPNFSKNSNKYQFKLNNNDEVTSGASKYESGLTSGNKFSSTNNYSYNQQVKPQKFSSPSYTNSKSSQSGGFTDESLINSLPEPARSNILAIIKRSKGLAQ